MPRELEYIENELEAVYVKAVKKKNAALQIECLRGMLEVRILDRLTAMALDIVTHEPT